LLQLIENSHEGVLKIVTKVSSWGVVRECLLASLDRPFFCKNYKQKQKRMAGSERMKRILKYAKGQKPARLVARSV
jgi:hypothetical protein